jgi:putative thioredoxin
MTDAAYKIVATIENFMPDVVEASASKPVLVDFWAPWCGPCQTLMPLLDRLADEYDGRFILAKVNTDEQQQIAQHFNIRSIPTVLLIHDREVAEQFVGAQPESAIRALLDKYVVPAAPEPEPAGATVDEPDPGRLDLVAGRQIDARDAAAAAVTVAALAASEPGHPRLPSLQARLAFLEAAAARPDVFALRAALEADPADCAARHAFAAHHALAGDYGTALAEWLDLMRRDRKYGDDLGRRSLLMAFDVLGPQDELVAGYRRRMAALLH